MYIYRYVMQRTSTLFRLLGDTTRLRLLRVLAQDRFNVSELTGILGVAQSGVSRHLGLLKDAGLVVEEREAGFVYYRLADEGRVERPRVALGAARRAVCVVRPTTARCARTNRGCRKCCGIARNTSTRTATRGSSCPAGAGPHGRARSATCCRRSTSPTSAAARAT